MTKYLRMIIVLSGITLLSGLALGGLNEMTFEAAANNVLRFKKIPAVASIYESINGKLDAEKRAALEETLLAEKIYLDVGEKEKLLVFVIKKDNKPVAVTIEKYGQGFGGLLGVIAGFNLTTNSLVGAGITTLSETPGVGTLVTKRSFTEQFSKMKKDAVYKVKKDGGDIDGISGATISSRAVANAIAQANNFYIKNQSKIKEALTR
jgi:electron transport complex protein RnfG